MYLYTIYYPVLCLTNLENTTPVSFLMVLLENWAKFFQFVQEIYV